MIKFISRVWRKRWVLRSILPTLYFNFHYLPFSQAIKLPILLYKPHFGPLKGKLSIIGRVWTGMIEMGVRKVSLYPNSGVVFENHGGELVFRGQCTIGSASAISIGAEGYLEFGHRVMANAAARFVAYHKVIIGDKCRLAWECMAMDTDFHAMTRPDGSLTKGYSPIVLGEGCWLGTGCLLQKGACLPPYTTVQARTVVAKEMDIPPRCVIGSDAKVIIKATDIYRDLDNDEVNYMQPKAK